MTAETENVTNLSAAASPRSRRWFTHLAQYTVVGAVAAACDIAVFTVLERSFEINYLIAASASFIVGTAVNFSICSRFVFRLHGHSWAVALWRKLLSGLAALGLNLLVMYLLVDGLGLGAMRHEFFLFDGLVVSRVVAIAAGFFLNFILTKYYAFRDY